MGAQAWGCPRGKACRILLLIPILTTVFLLLYFLQTNQWTEAPTVVNPQRVASKRAALVPPARKQPYDFRGFNNVTGLPSGNYLVPNFVHFLRFQEKEFSFVDFVVVLAAFKNQRPERLFFHTDVAPFQGVYWERLMATPGFADVVEVVHLDRPTEIFGQKFDTYFALWHTGDVTRLRILMQHGGIFLDNDSYLVRSLDEFRRFEMALGWDDNQFLGTQVIVAHPDARFLTEWLETYRGAYNSSRWYYNAGERPTTEVLFKRPELIHRVKLQFGVHDLRHLLYKDFGWLRWRDQHAIHLLIRHQSKKFNETNFMHPPTTFRELVLDVFNPYTGKPRPV